MLIEINGVLHSDPIHPERFQVIQKQATTLAQLQRKFGPPPTLHPSIETKVIDVDILRVPTLKVMNRGVEEAAAVLSHHGWSFSQIRRVLKPTAVPLGNLSFALMPNVQLEPRKINYQTSQRLKRKSTSVFKTLLIFFGCGGFVFLGVSLILHML